MKLVPLTRGKFAIVDAKYYDALIAMGTWCFVPYKERGYAHWRKKDGGHIRMHAAVLRLAGIKTTKHIDHRDGDGLNNRRRNLRPATRRQNNRNARRRSDNVSGFKGVSWKLANHKWVAQVRVNNRPKHLGMFDDPVEAAKAYDRAARKQYGSFARLNFPRESHA